jgi:hypothetical protein
MMGRLNHNQEQFFYSFRLDEAVPDDHPVREVAAVLDLSWVHSELAPYYPRLGRPSIDPVLMIRMLVVVVYDAREHHRAITQKRIVGCGGQDQNDQNTDCDVVGDGHGIARHNPCPLRQQDSRHSMALN